MPVKTNKNHVRWGMLSAVLHHRSKGQRSQAVGPIVLRFFCSAKHCTGISRRVFWRVTNKVIKSCYKLLCCCMSLAKKYYFLMNLNILNPDFCGTWGWTRFLVGSGVNPLDSGLPLVNTWQWQPSSAAGRKQWGTQIYKLAGGSVCQSQLWSCDSGWVWTSLTLTSCQRPSPHATLDWNFLW